MSFHEDSFHETKRERKYYEDRKQKALEYLDHTIEELNDVHRIRNLRAVIDRFDKKLNELRRLVNDI